MGAGARHLSRIRPKPAIDPGFQALDEELAALPGDHAAPRGALLLAEVEGAIAALPRTVPWTPDYPNAAEMKRPYVRKAFPGFSLGRTGRGHADCARQVWLRPVRCWDTLTTWNPPARCMPTWGLEEIPLLPKPYCWRAPPKREID